MTIFVIIVFVIVIGTIISSFSMLLTYTCLVFTIIFLLKYFNFEPSFKLRWCCAQELFGSQIPVTTGFQLRISCIQSSYLTHYAIRRLQQVRQISSTKIATLRQEWQIYVEILQLQAKFQTVMMSCSRIICITNFRDHKGI